MEETHHHKKNYSVLYAVIITAIVVFVISYFIFSYLPNQKQTTEIQEYKKAMYESILCQYQCPLVDQVSNNKTVTFPNATCVQQCSVEFRNKKLNGQTFSDAELLEDNLLKDIQAVIDKCKNEAIDQNASLPTVDNPKFFNCAVIGIKGLRDKYSYLK